MDVKRFGCFIAVYFSFVYINALINITENGIKYTIHRLHCIIVGTTFNREINLTSVFLSTVFHCFNWDDYMHSKVKLTAIYRIFYLFICNTMLA